MNELTIAIIALVALIIIVLLYLIFVAKITKVSTTSTSPSSSPTTAAACTSIATMNPVVVSNCDMFYYFTHGKTHDLYGLLVLIVVGVIMNLVSVSLLDKFVSLVDVIIGTGVFIDLWCHCFHH
jgi:uncharacterized protein YpmB